MSKASIEYQSSQTFETESNLELDDFTPQLKLIKDLKEQNDFLNSQLTKLKHESTTQISDLDNKLIILEKKNTNLQSFLDEIKNSKESIYSKETSEAKIFHENEIKELEFKIHNLESKINLSLEIKMELERKNNEISNENSLLKVENTKIQMENLRCKAKLQEISIEKNTDNEENYKNLTKDELMNRLMEKDEKIQVDEIKFEKFENDCYELYSEEIAKEFLNQKKIEEENISLIDKLREITNELETKKKELEEIEKSKIIYNEINNNQNNNNKNQNARLTKLRNSLLSPIPIPLTVENVTNNNNDNNNNNYNGDDGLSFNSEEVQMIVEKYQETEKALAELKIEYENEKSKWEFDIQRLESYYAESEQSMKIRIDDLSRINEKLHKEITEIENHEFKQIKSDGENYYLIENEELNRKIYELQDSLSNKEYSYKEKLSNMKKEIREKEDFTLNLTIAKDNMSKEIENLICSFAKKENEIREKNRIEINIKNNENIQLVEKIEMLNKENLEKKNIINLMKNNYDKLLKNFESLKTNNEKKNASNDKEIIRLNEEKEKIKKFCNKDINEKINEINLLKEKIKELQIEKKSFNENNNNNNYLSEGGFALNEILEEENEKNNLSSYQNELNKKEEKIINLEIELNSLNKKVKKLEELENEIIHLNSLTNTQAENLLKQKEFYEKQINELQKKALDINADLLVQKRRTTTMKTDSVNYNPKQLAIIYELEMEHKKLNAENRYQKDQIEIIKEELEKNKISRENDVKFYKEELIVTEKAAVEAKFALATMAFDKDCEIVKLMNLCKRYKTKLANSDINVSNNNIGRVHTVTINKK
jgi:hypothetical protein